MEKHISTIIFLPIFLSGKIHNNQKKSKIKKYAKMILMKAWNGWKKYKKLC
jgi:hypothetical protein